jgi:hypothetical protein
LSLGDVHVWQNVAAPDSHFSGYEADDGEDGEGDEGRRGSNENDRNWAEAGILDLAKRSIFFLVEKNISRNQFVDGF